MGCAGSKTADELTVDLWELVNKKLTRWESPSAAQGMLAGGASIRQAQGGKYMIEECREQEKRNRQANRTREADLCERVAKLLVERANQLLVDAVSQGRLADVQLFAQKLGGDLHQSEGYGQLGLMSVALKSPNVSLPLVQFLVENHPKNRAAIGLAVTATSPAAPLHKACADQQVSGYLLHQLNLLLLELPSTVPAGQGNEGANADRLVNSAEAMIKNGANPTLVDPQANNVLCHAVLLGHVPLARRLLHLGLDSTYVNPSTGLSVLQLAESQSHRDPVLVALLKGHSFNLNFQQRIHAMRDEKECDYDAWHAELQTLLTQGADIHCLNSQQETPLHLLVQSLAKLDQEDDARFVTMFLADFHADPERANLQNLRPIEQAILSDRNLRVLRELLDASALLNAKTNTSILVFARNAPESEHKAATIALIQTFMNNKLWQIASKANRRGKNHEAIAGEVRTILGLGADINARTGDDEHEGYTPLCLVAQQGDAFLVKKFIQEFGANPLIASEGETSFNNSPLHTASEAGQLASVQFLRSLQVNMNVLNTKKETALHLAARAGHVRVVKFLALWGCDTTLKSEEGLTALEAAEQGASSAGGKKEAQHPLTIAFLTRCEPSPVCQEPAVIIAQANLQLVDVCQPVRLQPPANLVPSGPSDEDPLGDKSRGLIKGKPNDNLKSAAKSGNLADAKLAVSEGADVRHRYDDKSIHAIALASQADASRSADRSNNSDQAWEYRRKARNCGEVATYLAEVATTKLKEAVEQGNEARVAGYHAVGGSLNGLVGLAARSTASVGIMHFLVTQHESNRQYLWRNFDGPTATHAPYHVAKAKKFDALAEYIRAQLTVELVSAVDKNDLGHVRECIEAGGLPDLDGRENLAVAVQHGNVDLARLLLDYGARLPQRFPTLASIEQDQAISQEMRLLLRQRFLDRAVRLAAVTGDINALLANHHQGGDLSATNCFGATPLSLSLQYTHQPVLVHYVVTRGGTMLHKHAGVASCIPLARSAGHPANNLVEGFLKQSLNVALFNSVMEGDLTVSAALCALGADLSALDEAGNSLVHTAVAFQGLDAVKWLTERGCPLNIANANGEYAITAAVLKGDAASVEYMIHTNAGTKALKNGNGKTALDLAKDARYNKLVQLMDPGNTQFPVSEEDDALAEPSQEYEELIRAASYGQLDAIKIFIEEKYASLARKTQIAAEMVRVAESKKQAEVLRILVPHYKSLTSEVASDQTNDRLVSASAEQKAILAGFLTGLTGMIAGGEVALDPSDPATYQQLFSNLGAQQGAQAEFLQKNLANPGEMTKAVTKEAQDLSAKMQKLEQEMRAMADSKANLTKRLQSQEAQLAACKTAVAKKDCYREIQEAKEQLNTLASSVALFGRAAEAAAKKKKTLESLKSQPNLLVAYSTIENRLQGLFLACKSATSGMMSLNMTEQGETRMTIVGVAASIAEVIPVVGSTLSSVISVGVGGLVTHLDKNKQQQEIANITTLANIEELNKAASNAAALVTYYYSAQINSVITTGEKKAEESVPQLAEYLVLFMIKALQKGRIVAGIDLATQLWYSTASQDPLKPQSLVDRLLGTPGDIKVRVKGQDNKVSLRGLIGSVGVMDAKNQLHIPDAKALSSVQKTKKDFEPFYSISYLSAFTTEAQLQLIITRRGLVPASGDAAKNFLTSSVRLTDEEAATLKSSVSVFQDQTAEDDGAVVPLMSPSSSSKSAEGGIGGDITHVSLQVHSTLANKGLVVTKDQVRELIQQSQGEATVGLELEVETLREDFNTKANQFQTSIDAATETITTESEKMRAEHRAVQKELQQSTTKQLAEQQASFAKQLAQQNAAQEAKLVEITAKHEASLAELQAKMAASYAELQASNAAALKKLQEDAAAQLKAVTDAQQAALASMVASSAAAQKEATDSKAVAEKAAASAATTLAQSTAASEKWSADLAASKAAYDAALKTSTDASAKTIAEYKTNLDTLKEAAKTSAAAAKESEKASQQTSKEMKELRELQAKDNKSAAEVREKELKALKEQAASEAKALLSQAKDAEKAASQAADASKKAASDAKKAASDAEDAKATAQKLEAKLNSK